MHAGEERMIGGGAALLDVRHDEGLRRESTLRVHYPRLRAARLAEL